MCGVEGFVDIVVGKVLFVKVVYCDVVLKVYIIEVGWFVIDDEMVDSD